MMSKYNLNLISNFPEHYSSRKRLFSNLIHLIGDIKIPFKSKCLSNEEIKGFKKTLQPGDVVLSGGLQMLSSVFVQGAVTHALLYIGKKKFIHSTAHGVTTCKFKYLYKNSNTLVILRHKEIEKMSMRKIRKFLQSNLGKPYNFEFKKNRESYLCTELIQEAFINSGLEFRLNQRHENLFSKSLHPMDFIHCNDLELKFHSKNLKIINNTLMHI